MEIEIFAGRDDNGQPFVKMDIEECNTIFSVLLSPDNARNAAAALTQMSIIAETETERGK